MNINGLHGQGEQPRILVVERQPLYREALVRLLGADFAGGAVKGHGEIEALAADPPALAMIGDDLAGSPDVLRPLALRLPGTAIVVHGSSADAETIAGMIGAGARGYVPKTAEPAVIVAAVRLVLSGGVYLPEAVLGARHLREPRPEFDTTPAEGALGALTPRQRAVLDLIARGYANKDIAEALAISLATVKVHVNAILKHLHVTNRTAAALAVLKRPAAGA